MGGGGCQECVCVRVCMYVYIYIYIYICVCVCVCVCVTKVKLSLHSLQADCQQYPESLMDENTHMLRAFGDISQALTACYR